MSAFKPNVPSSLDDLAQRLKDKINVDDGSIVIGYSGGLDSSVLLHATARAFPADKILAVHCDHGISDHSEKWSKHCEQQAQSLNIRFLLNQLHLGKGASEELARDTRYACFTECMEPLIHPVLLLAHHADDQIETVLFRLFRGSGLKGLSGIPESRAIGKGKLFRPFLDISRPNLLEIAQQENIRWIEDGSNQTDSYDRNFLRNKVLPLIYTRWPKAADQILHARSVFDETSTLLNEYAESIVATLDLKPEAFGRSIFISELKQLTHAQYKLALQHLIDCNKDIGSRLKDSDFIEIKHQFFSSKEDASPKLKIGNTDLRRYKDRLYILHNLPNEINLDRSISWDGIQPLQITDIGTLSLLDGASETFEIRFRQGSERAKPVSRAHSQTLKKLMQESDIEPWLRSRIPLVFLGDTLLSVGGSIRCSEHQFHWQWKN